MKLFRWWSRTAKATEQAEASAPDAENPFPDLVTIEITDVFDLHAIPPQQTSAVIEEYLLQAHARGYRYVRIIHGKGIGMQREITRNVLARTSFVVKFHDAPPEAGGWGATVVELKVIDQR